MIVLRPARKHAPERIAFEEEKEDDPSLFIFPREEKFYWSLSSAQIVTENAMLLDLIAWMRREKKSGKNETELREGIYCLQLKSRRLIKSS